MTQRIPGLTYTEDILNEAKANRSRHLYVGNIGSKITENELTECLCKYGKVCDCSIFKKDGISYAVVGMLNVPEATKVMQSQACLKDRKLRFRYKHYDSCVPDELLPLEPESDTDDQISEKKEEKIYRTLIETTQLAQAFPIKNIVEKREENVTPNVDTFFRAQGKTHAPQINILDSIEETNHLRLREKLYFEATRFGSVLAIYITPTMISLIFKDEISAIDALKGFFTLSMLGRTQPFEKVELLRKKIENIVPAIKEMTDLSLENICTIQKDGISRTLFIGNIDPTVTEADIKDAFSAFGEIWQIDGKLQTGSLSS